MTEFNRRYRQRFGIEPIYSAANSYDAVMIAFKAITKSRDQGLSLNEVLNKNSFRSITFGEIVFDKIGGVSKSDFIIQSL